MEPKLAAAISERDLLLAQLREQFPDVDEQTIQDTVEGETEVNEMLAAILRSSLDDLALVVAIKTRMSDMTERIERISGRAEKKREIVRSVMERADIKRLDEPDMTVSLRAAAPPLIVTDKEIVPDMFWLAQPPKLDKKGMRQWIMDGKSVPGAFLGNTALTISVRTK